ncbi:MAG: RluA family pseudouridine synthase [Polyangiaceae bacterium]|nr:RluA family pseudouridine synthase [Polyangiaceae bacterium]
MRAFRAPGADGPADPTAPPGEPARPPGVAPDALLRVLRVPPESAGLRLDVFVQSQLRNTSRTRSRAIVENSAYDLEGRRLRANDRVRAEQRVALWRPAFEEADLRPVQLRLVHEDAHLLVVDKPPLMAVHPTARHHSSTLMKQLELARGGERVWLIHRLDRETSGLVLVARSPEADRAFKRLFEERSTREATSLAHASSAGVAKTYLALTWGAPSEGDVRLPVEPDTANPLRVKMRIAAPGTGLPARTSLTVREVRGRYALVECELHTGRQHQIRVHLAALGTPVVGDKLYGPDERLLARAADGELTSDDLARLELPRHALHAHRYRLRHPLTGEELELVAPLPADLADFWGSKGASG